MPVGLGSERRLARFLALALTACGAASLLGVSGSGTSSSRLPVEAASSSRPRGKSRHVHPARAGHAPAAHPPSGADVDPPEVQVGERLFLETRFAQYFAAHGAGTNVPLAAGDPAMEALPTSDGPLPGPFAGLSMNCRNCHLVDDTAGAPTRTYADYSRQSLVPSRADGQERTPRNSPSLVNANLARPVPFLLHFDGEFASLDDLVRGTLTGRNFGWLPGEAPQAIAQIARVIREDDGSDANAQGFGGVPYRTLLTGTDPSIPAELVLPAEYRLDAASADDAAIFAAVARLISAYTVSLAFANASPYDAFLAKNGLPAAPDPGESDLAYSRRLRAAVEALADPVFVGPGDGEFSEHDQEFVFGPDELKGMKIFFREPLPQTLAGDPRYLSPRTGNCIACHAAPNFTDFSFHNTGVAQEEFDAAEGDGAFAALFVPDLGERAAHPDAFLPATAAHPAGSGVFRRPPLDLGVWNVYGNPDFPAPQAALAGILGPLSAQTLRDSIARFKTPGLRDLGQSGPYLHTGRKRDLEEVLELYAASSAKQRAGGLRNGADELSGMFLGEGDIDPLAAFLRALNEDYN